MANHSFSPTRLPSPAQRPIPLGRPEEPRDLLAGLDAALLIGVLLLAFLLASTPARNSDLWLHLSAGRLIAAGQYQFGVDPFSFTTEGVYWANHAWLFDLILYHLYQTLGGPALVIAKALLATVLALVLLSIRRPGQSFWLPGTMTALSLLAMSPRLLLLPTVVSYLFLAITLCVLYRRDSTDNSDPSTGLFSPRRLWLLPPLFALWVNLDGWFFLGPLSIALHLLGEVLQGAVGPALPPGERTTPHRRRVLAAVLVVGLAACLLSPHHIYAFTLPTELSFAPGVEAGRVDARLQWFFTSPFSERFFRQDVGGSVAGLAFFPLVLAGALSFVLARSEPRWGRILTWIVFFLLAAYNWQLIAFFAIVAGPITVLNCQDFLARRRQADEHDVPADRLALDRLVAFVTFRWWPGLSGSGKLTVVLLVALIGGGLAWLKSGSPNADLTLTVLTIPQVPIVALGYLALLVVLAFAWLTLFVRHRYEAFGLWSLGGRYLTLLLGLGLLIAVWPGWLHGNWRDPYLARRVGWDILPDASLMRTAEQLRRWREQGLLPESARGMNLLHQAAGYWAWYGDGEKTFYDLRLPLFKDVRCASEVSEALAVRERSGADASQEAHEKRQTRMQECLREHRITHIILHGSDSRTLTTIRNLVSDSAQWQPLYLDGRTAIFAWNDPKAGESPHPLSAVRYDALRRAFGTVPEEERIPEPKLLLLFNQWGLGRYLVAPPPHRIESDEAEIHRHLFLRAGNDFAARWSKQWHDTYAARLPACGAVAASIDGGVGSATTFVSLQALRMRVAEPIFFPEQFREPKRPQQELAFLQEAMLRFVDHFRYQFDAGPPEHALLAVRAARRATALEPEDPNGWLRLADAYQNLQYGTQARVWTERTPILSQLRRAQTIAALQSAATLEPDSLETHRRLANLFNEMGYLDLHLKHLGELARIFREAGQQPGESPEAFKVRMEDMDRELGKIEKSVKDRRDLYYTASQGKPPLEQAHMAMNHGLALLALETLQQTTSEDLGVSGYQLQLQLLIDLGRLEEVRAFGWDDARTKLGVLQADSLSPQMPAADWFRLQVAAATGEYAEARKALDALLAFDSPALQGLLAAPRGSSLGSVLLAAGQATPMGKPWAASALEAVERRMFTNVFVTTLYGQVQQRADLLTVRGILALEVGDTNAAADDFRAALAVTPEFGARMAAERYLELIERARKQ